LKAVKIRYDYHTNSIGEMDEADIPASMAAVETAIRAAYPLRKVEEHLMRLVVPRSNCAKMLQDFEVFSHGST